MNKLTLAIVQRIARDTEKEALVSGNKVEAQINGTYKLIVYLIDRLDKLEEALNQERTGK